MLDDQDLDGVPDVVALRVVLEVPRIVVTGDFTAKEETALREKFVTLEVRQGLKADHDMGLDAWYMAQNERFSIQPKDDRKASK